MRDSLWKASARWGYVADCQPQPAIIYDKKHITRTLKNVNAGIRVKRLIERYEINLPSGRCTSVHLSLGRQQKMGEHYAEQYRNKTHFSG